MIYILILLASVISASAQTYLEMTEVTTNAMTDAPVYLCVPVANQQEAATLKETFANDADLFRGLEYTAVYHVHNHRPQTEPCEVVPIKADMSKSVTIESVETDVYNLATKFILPVKDKDDSTKKIAKVKSMFPDKTFTVKEHGL